MMPTSAHVLAPEASAVIVIEIDAKPLIVWLDTTRTTGLLFKS
jgi:hypothetical protein